MVDLWTYIEECTAIVEEAKYAAWRIRAMTKDWSSFAEWAEENQITSNYFEAGCTYLDMVVGTHILDRELSERQKLLIRNIRMLVSYARDGAYEFRTPKIEYKTKGYIGSLVEKYLIYCDDILGLSNDTIRNKRYYLILFNNYMVSNQLNLDSINHETFTDFYTYNKFSLSSIHNASSVLRGFLEYLENTNMVSNPLSFYVTKSNYKKKAKLPTVYDETEVKNLIESIDRAGAIGKRDYLVLLLACEYGWRAGDIVNFQFSHIDWERNIIHFKQSKTKEPCEFPLLASVGNAIIDYLKNGRYKSDSPYIILSHSQVNRHQPLHAETIHSIVTKAFKNSKIKDWGRKKHGPHSLRHSLATNLLKQNMSMPLISVILGHQSTETTKTYLSLDIESLRKCCLPFPKLESKLYMNDEDNIWLL